MYKKITFLSNDGDQDVYKKLSSEDSENSGFTKLKGCDGCEHLQCTKNCSDLEFLNCATSVKDLESHISGKGKIYIKEMQISVYTIPLAPERNESKIKQQWGVYSDIFYVKDLKKFF